MTRALILSGLLAASLAAAAAAPPDPWYDVELIVFEYKGTSGDAPELWSADPGAPELDGAVEPVATDAAAPRRAGPAPFQLLDAASRRLNGLEGRLARSPDYAPLLHLAWRQPVATGTGQGVRVHGGQGGAEVDGVVRINRGRFLAAGADLVYHEDTGRGPAAPNVFNRPPGQAEAFRLQQSRRIRSGELNYFDHPRFGAVILVTPFDAQARQDAAGGEPESAPATD
jgi:hypothetical protein